MDESAWDRPDALGQRLTYAVPDRTPITPQVEDALAEMAVRARRSSSPVERTRRTWRVATLSLATAVLFGGVGVAAASTLDSWAWWLQEPDGAYFFTSLSGESCEYRVGMISSSDADLEKAFQESHRAGVVLDQNAIVGAWLAIQADYDTFRAERDAAGKEAPFVPSEAEMWEMAVMRVVRTQVVATLAAQGFDQSRISEAGTGTKGDIQCSEAADE